MAKREPSAYLFDAEGFRECCGFPASKPIRSEYVGSWFVLTGAEERARRFESLDEAARAVAAICAAVALLDDDTDEDPVYEVRILDVSKASDVRNALARAMGHELSEH